jgi:PAS domain S-box-containing protein
MKVKKNGRSGSDREEKTVRCAAAQSSALPAVSPENEDSLQAFLNALDDLVFVFEPEGRILFTNPAAQNQLGYTPAELAGMTALDLHPPEQRPEAAKLLAGMMAGKIMVCPIPLQARDGTRIPVETKILHGQWRGATVLFGISHDITGRKQAEETIVHERQLLRTLIDLLPEIFYIKDLNSRFLVANEALAKHFGQESSAQMLGLSDADFYSAELAARFRAEELKVFGGEPLIDQEAKGVSPVGREGTFLTTKVPFRDSQGRIQGLVGIGRDITERKQAEAALRESEERHKTLLETTDTGYVILDADGKVCGANREYVRLTGHGALAEIVGKNVVEWTAAHDRERNAAEIRRCLQQGFVRNLEIDYMSREGRIVPVEVNATVVKSSQGVQILALCRDITERKMAEEAVRESEGKFRSIFENAPIGIFQSTIEGRLLTVNSAAVRMFRYDSPEEMLTATPDISKQLFVRPEQRRDIVRLALESRKYVRQEVEYRRKDGSVFIANLHMRVLRNDKNEAVSVEGFVEDITDRRWAEKSQGKNSDRLNRINSCLLNLGPDHDSNVSRLTALCGELLEATCALYNRLQGDLLCSIGQWHTPSVFKSEDAPAGHICYDVIRNNREEAVVITNLPRTAYAESDPNVRAHGLQTYMGCAVKCEGKAVGSLCVVYNTDYRPTDDDRRILGIIASAIGNEDTRKHAEAELNRLMTAIEQTPESVVITDTKGRILYVNPVFERVTGYNRAEAIGQNPRLLKSNRQDSAFYRELWAKIRAGEVWRGRFINKKKDGTLFTEDAVIAPVRDEKGTVTNYIAIKRDISHELELEVQYRQTQKIDSIGRLAGGVAHDFNNILAVICGHTDLALAQLSPDAPLRSNLECIQESAERAANLTRQLLAFARRQVIEPRRINLNELIVNLNKMLHRLIGEDIKLVTQTAPDLGQIKADPGQIEQVLLNLVVNARDAMPDGGTLTIRTDNVTLDEDYARRHLITPGDYVMVSISDTGVGMTDEVKQHIFEPFFTTKEQGKGTGLGLATCFGIIQQSNGHIHAESQVDKGAQFKIYLPRVLGVEESISSHEAPVSLPQGTETILLAEDESSLRQLMARVLRTQGYTVLEAADGHQALALAQANGPKIQLLLTDVIMPGLSGKTLAEWLGQVNPQVRVLFISGYINNNAVRDAMSRPGTFFLQKPFNPLDLTKKVREAIETP